MGLINKLRVNRNEPVKGLPTEKNTVYAPVAGKLIALEYFPDDVFNDGTLGQGCGIAPTDEIIKAPFNGEVVQLQTSQHALGLKSEDGIELLIHVGVDTVSMEGKGFQALVKKGDKVVMGQNILKFSIAEIKAKGLKTEVAIIVTNTDDYQKVNIVNPGDIEECALIITVV